jgi:NADH-quinone oxidoreductase subunit L
MFYYVALFTALLTAIYMTRLMVLVFLGKFRGDSHAKEHLHESPLTMQIPMWILAAGCVFAGYVWSVPHEESHMSVWFFVLSGTAAAVIGLLFAGIYFSKKIPKHPGHNELVGFARTWTLSFDVLHYFCGVLPTRIAVFVLSWVNIFLRITVNIICAIPMICSESLRYMQANRLRMQLSLSVVCSIILAYWLVFFIR